ncbi:MAG: ABC transporter ATP-binding protein [Labrys sp. (in: a-proteobacteria)]|jgi:ABC-type microcin C transport system duplicated ATPase subunit YejF
MEEILSIEDLRVAFKTNDGTVEAVRGVSLAVKAGETLAIVGESGSGKSQTMMAAMGLLAANGTAKGRVRYRGRDILGLPTRALNEVRGRHVGMIFQEPMTSLDPLCRIGDQLMEPIRHHQKIGKEAARARAIDLLTLVRIPEPALRMRSYPHELSGGQRQRVMIAMAIANEPDLLIADEPTTALDVTIQAEILALLKDLQRRLGMALVFITHDLGIVRRIADRVVVMQGGGIVETGATADIFRAATHPYTRALLAAEPTGRKEAVASSAPVILSGRDVRIVFHLSRGFLGGRSLALTAVDGVSLSLSKGQTIGIVGESGSGKSTLARGLLRLVPSEGQIRFEGRDLGTLDKRAMRPLRKGLQIVLQDPFGSLSPRMTSGEIVTEGLLVHDPGLSARERDARAAEAFREVGLDPALRNRYPHEFSGGQRQRIAIARAIILKPKVVVLDEPTSALDRQVQRQVIDLLRDLQTRHGLSYLFISHDLAVVRAMADYVMVMKDGRVVEEGPTPALFDAPREAYTQRLMAAALG